MSGVPLWVSGSCNGRPISPKPEALANVEIIIHEWIETAKEEGREIPKPKGRLVFAQPELFIK